MAIMNTIGIIRLFTENRIVSDMFKKLLCFVVVLLVCGCSKNFDDSQVLSVYRDMSEQQLYNYAFEAISDKDYSSAIKRLEAMDIMYPFSRYSRQVLLYTIYAYFKSGDYAQCVASSERFIHVYPRDREVDYAYYMRGVANFEQERGTFARLFNLDVSWRDPGTQWASYKDFLSLVQRFPKSRYYPDSMKRMIFLRNQFANRELNIAHFYIERKRYVAALERAKYVIRHYGQAPQAKSALILSAKINKILGLKQAVTNDNKVLHDTYG